MKHAAPKDARTIVDKIAHHRGSIVPPVSGSTLRHPSRAKSNPGSKRLDAMKSENVDSGSKVAPTLTPLLRDYFVY